MRNDILKLIKEQNWGSLENFELKKKIVTEKLKNFLREKTFFFSSKVF